MEIYKSTVNEKKSIYIIINSLGIKYYVSTQTQYWLEFLRYGAWKPKRKLS